MTDLEVGYDFLIAELAKRGEPGLTYQKLWNKINGRTDFSPELRGKVLKILQSAHRTASEDTVSTATIPSRVSKNTDRLASTDFLFSEIAVWPGMPSKDWEVPVEGEAKMDLVPALFTGEQRRLITVTDDSLDPIVMRGQKIILQIDPNPREGMIVAVKLGERVEMGFYERTNGHWMVRPPNPEYSSIELTDAWERVGYVAAKMPYANEHRGTATWDFDDGVRS